MEIYDFEFDASNTSQKVETWYFNYDTSHVQQFAIGSTTGQTTNTKNRVKAYHR